MSRPALIGGRYLAASKTPLAEGGFGRILVCEDRQRPGASVALKIARDTTPDRQEECDRSIRHEAAILASLNHPHIVRLFDQGEHRGRPFFTMELVAGSSLAAEISHESAGRAGRGLAQKTLLLAQFAEALTGVHQAGLAHLDVKPENLLVTAEGRAVLIDFGSAIRLGQHLRAEVQTKAYAAPEQIRGPGVVDARTDVFAFGLAAYQYLALRHPFGSADDGIYQRIVSDPVPPLNEAATGVPPELAAIIHSCLIKNLHGRPPSLAPVAVRLRSLHFGDSHAEILERAAGLRAAGRWQELLDLLYQAMARDPVFLQAREVAWNACMDFAEDEARKGRLDHATELAREALNDLSTFDARKQADARAALDRYLQADLEEKRIQQWLGQARSDLAQDRADSARYYLDQIRGLRASHPGLLEVIGEHWDRTNGAIEALMARLAWEEALTRLGWFEDQVDPEGELGQSVRRLRERLLEPLLKQLEACAQDPRQEFFQDAARIRALLTGDPGRIALVDEWTRRRREDERRRGREEAVSKVLTHCEELASRGQQQAALDAVAEVSKLYPDDEDLRRRRKELAEEIAVETRAIVQQAEVALSAHRWESALSLLAEGRARFPRQHDWDRLARALEEARRGPGKKTAARRPYWIYAGAAAAAGALLLAAVAARRPRSEVPEWFVAEARLTWKPGAGLPAPVLLARIPRDLQFRVASQPDFIRLSREPQAGKDALKLLLDESVRSAPAGLRQGTLVLQLEDGRQEKSIPVQVEVSEEAPPASVTARQRPPRTRRVDLQVVRGLEQQARAHLPLPAGDVQAAHPTVNWLRAAVRGSQLELVATLDKSMRDRNYTGFVDLDTSAGVLPRAVQVNMDIKDAAAREHRIMWTAAAAGLAPGAELVIRGCTGGTVPSGELAPCQPPREAPRQMHFHPAEADAILRAVFRKTGPDFELSVRNTGSHAVDSFTLLYVE